MARALLLLFFFSISTALAQNPTLDSLKKTEHWKDWMRSHYAMPLNIDSLKKAWVGKTIWYFHERSSIRSPKITDFYWCCGKPTDSSHVFIVLQYSTGRIDKIECSSWDFEDFGELLPKSVIKDRAGVLPTIGEFFLKDPLKARAWSSKEVKTLIEGATGVGMHRLHVAYAWGEPQTIEPLVLPNGKKGEKWNHQLGEIYFNEKGFVTEVVDPK